LLGGAREGDSQLTMVSGRAGHGHHLRTIDATGLFSLDVAGDFPPRAWGERERRLAGHGRWPSPEYLAHERFTLITPYFSLEPPTRTSDPRPAPAVLDGLPLVTVPQRSGEYFRFRTGLTRSELERRARERGLFLCVSEPATGALHCFGQPWWPAAEDCERLRRPEVVDAFGLEFQIPPEIAADLCQRWRSLWVADGSR
jgi:hypothetical protein